MDERRLRTLNERYFSALDCQDLDALAQTFAVDAQATYLDGQWVMNGRDEIVDKMQAIRGFASSVHVLANAVYRPGDRDICAGLLFVIAHLATDALAARVVVRGLRYEDVYEFSTGEPLIRERTQVVLWQYEVPATEPSIAAGASSRTVED